MAKKRLTFKDKEAIHDELVFKTLEKAIRNATIFWYAKNEAYKRARTGIDRYTCASCKKQFSKDNKETACDHIDPIMPVTGFDGYNNYVPRALSRVDNFQILCKNCHRVKTNKENAERRKNRT